MRFAIRTLAGVVGVALTAGLTACGSSTPDPTPAAAALAQAVATGGFDAVPLAGGTAADAAATVEQATEGMGEATRTVTVASVEETGEDTERKINLDIAWDLDGAGGPDGGGADWTYTTGTLMTLVEEEWRVEWTPAVLHPRLAAGDRLRLGRQQAERADVLGADGTPIVTERPVWRIGIDKPAIDEGSHRAAATALADLVDVDAAAFADRVEASGPRAFVEAITLREEDATPVLPQVEGITGARAIQGTLALAPTRDFARPVLGSAGDATAEIVEESGGAIVAGDVVGLSGLQQQYDERLRGGPGLTVELVRTVGLSEGAPEGEGAPGGEGAAEGEAEAEPEEPEEEAEVIFEREPRPGEPVTITLDTQMQIRAERILADVGPASALVAIQPSTGNVLAAASGPGGEGFSTATLAQHAPGSTFKIVAALALLRAGLAPDAALECPPTTVVDGRSFKNYGDYPASAVGTITFREAIANSCNTAMIGQYQTVTQADLTAAAASLGLGAAGDPGVPAYTGSVPADSAGTEHAASMIGQGKVLASPLAMATVAASIAAGETVTPKLVEATGEQAEGVEEGAGAEGTDDGGEATEGGEEPGAGEPAAVDAPPLTAEEAAALQGLLRAVVEGGSATFLADVPGEPVGAKTGTAEYGTDVPPRTHAWMIATQGDLAVAAFVEDGPSGSRTAGPLLEAFLTGA